MLNLIVFAYNVILLFISKFYKKDKKSIIRFANYIFMGYFCLEVLLEASMKKMRMLFYCAITVAIFIPAVVLAGQTVSEGERLGKPCAGCHATNGYAPGEYIARIGGQNTEYLTKTMKEYATGKRPGSVEMAIVAKGYSEPELVAISEFFGTKKWKNTTNHTDKKLVAKGKKIAADKGCNDCHGVKGEGMDSFPRIGGQNKGFMNEAMKRYKAGQIESEEMAVVKELSDEEILALSEYFASLK